MNTIITDDPKVSSHPITKIKALLNDFVSLDEETRISAFPRNNEMKVQLEAMTTVGHQFINLAAELETMVEHAQKICVHEFDTFKSSEPGLITKTCVNCKLVITHIKPENYVRCDKGFCTGKINDVGVVQTCGITLRKYKCNSCGHEILSLEGHT